MLSVDVVSKSFGDNEILRGVSFSARKGETVAILGPSGIGKSTLLRLIANTDTDFVGSIERPRRMAVVFQNPTLLPWRNVGENVSLVHQRLDATVIRSALERVGIGAKAQMFPRQLSLGEQRRLALARALAGRPELLIMDEPFVSLDGKTAQDMLALTEQLIDEIRPTTLFVTHQRAEAERLGTRIIELGGSPATLIC